jgi:Nucleotide modification associated domain 1
MNQTDTQYDSIINACKDIFLHKTADYGSSWRVYRTISVVDQIYIKAKRIRTIQEKGEQRIGDDVASEFMGIVNYAIIGLVQLDLQPADTADLSLEQVTALYTEKAACAKALMGDKNHDYGEAWREMSQESFVDLMLNKLLRIKQIIANQGKTLISEGIDANYYDILNYAVFALILIKEEKH